MGPGYIRLPAGSSSPGGGKFIGVHQSWALATLGCRRGVVVRGEVR